MIDIEINNSDSEATTPEVQQTQAAVPENQPKDAAMIPENQPSSRDHIKKENLVAMRKKMEEAERRAEQAERRAYQIEQQHYQTKNAQPQPQSVDEEDTLDPDDYVAHKQLKKTAQKITTKLTESERKINDLEQKIAYFEAKNELDSIKDFNDVVTDENLKTFARLYPEDYDTVMSNPNLKAKSKTAYNMIKNYGIAEVNPLVKHTEQARALEKKIESNKARPSTASAASSASPLVNASRYDSDGRLVLTEADRDIITKDMRRKMGLM
jgi:hypothetical protein